eukprot:351900-Chlamydomonas_euryale.AAC.6
MLCCRSAVCRATVVVGHLVSFVAHGWRCHRAGAAVRPACLPAVSSTCRCCPCCMRIAWDAAGVAGVHKGEPHVVKPHHHREQHRRPPNLYQPQRQVNQT